ncbi:MAG TPA: sigma-70 family RNA polymerase sigma factor [Thermoanaerobacter sp.]|nr:sigma-70 family RNA polymerase sigma factor [Thermoanaerobacter sp.]
MNSILTKKQDDELELFKRLKNGDKSARNKIVEKNIGLAVNTALKYSRAYGIELEDLVQEGIIGLIEAAEKFDYTKGFKFSTFAVYYIKQKIHHYFQKYANQVSFSRTGYEKIKKIHSLEQYSENFSVEEIAEITGLKEEDVIAVLPLQNPLLSLNQSFAEDNTELSEAISDERSEEEIIKRYEMQELKKILKQALETLNESERKVLKLRFGLTEDGVALNQRQISKILGVTKQRVWRIEKKALEKLQKNWRIKKVLKDFLYE